jgi:hypothetical protein
LPSGGFRAALADSRDRPQYASFDSTTSVALIRSPGLRSARFSSRTLWHRHRRHQPFDLFMLDRELLRGASID